MSVESAANPQRDAFIHGLLARAAAVRMPKLFHSEPSGCLFHAGNWNGVGVAALRTRHLTDEQLVQVMTYRLAQYLMARQLDPNLIFESRLEYEPLSGVTPDDVHVIVGDAESGEILCYATLKAPAEALAGVTMAAEDRWLFPVEQVFGRGLYNRLRILPDLPVARVRELGRFAKNHHRDAHTEVMIRAPVEVGVAMFRVAGRLLATEVGAVVGDVEEGVAKKNLDFFHIPLVVLHGVVPYAAEGSFGFLNYQTRTRYPFAFLAADVSQEWLDAVENALRLPGREGLVALLGLKGHETTARSGLEPAGGLGALADAPIPQRDVPMAARRMQLDVGGWLRTSDAFHGLSVAEAAVLGTFMSRCNADVGDIIVHQGDTGDDLYVIQSGSAEVQVVDRYGDAQSWPRWAPARLLGKLRS